MKFAALGLLGHLVCLPSAFAQTNVGACFSFQLASGATNYSEAVSASTFPGTPAFSRTGSSISSFDNFGASFTAFDGSVWVPGKCAGWNNSASEASTNNTWQVTLNTTSVTELVARFKYRLNNATSGGLPVTRLSAFDYRVGTGAFQSVTHALPGVSLTLANNTDYNNIWTANLAGLTGIENKGSVTLRWTLPNLDASAFRVRVDDLQITGVRTGTPPASVSIRPRHLPVGTNWNVLFIAFDDLKANFGAFVTPELDQQMPKPITPNLDSLAASGMSFTRAYCQQPVCWASRASLLTGVRPDTTRIWDDGPQIRDTMPGIITLPQHFAEQGYSAAGTGKIFDPRSATDNQDQPLSWPDGKTDPGLSFNNTGTAHNYYENGHWQVESNAPTGTSRQNLFSTDAGVTNYWVTPNRPVNNADYVDGIIANAGIAKLNAFASNYLSTGKRFFLAVGFKKPHLPFVSPKSYWDLYDPAQIKLTNHVNRAAYTGARTVPQGTLPFTAASYEISSYDDIPSVGVTNENQARQLIHAYLATTSFVDAQFGRVMAALNASGVASNTIVVIWGDHGFHLGDHNGFWAKHSCYEQAARAPLIISAPGMATLGTAGKPCAQPVEFVDIYSTLVDLAGLPTPDQPSGLALQGTSLRPLLEDPAQPWKKAAFTQYQRFISGTGVANPGNGMGYSIRTSRYRYTEWWRTASTLVGGDSTNRHVKLFSSPEHVELYDLLTDPNETVNQTTNSAFASVKAELAAALAGGYGWSNAPVAVPATYSTNYAVWQTHLLEPGYPLASFAETNDIDGDGIKSLLEYTMGVHPLYADTHLPGTSVTNISGIRYLALQYSLVGARTDVTTRGVMSTNLTSWSTNGVTYDNLGTNANHIRWRARIPINGTNPRNGFLRLKAEH